VVGERAMGKGNSSSSRTGGFRQERVHVGGAYGCLCVAALLPGPAMSLLWQELVSEHLWWTAALTRSGCLPGTHQGEGAAEEQDPVGGPHQ